MQKKTIYIVLIALIVTFLASMPFWYKGDTPPKNKKRKLDWTPTFKKTETKPYASLILYQMLGDLFPKKEITLRVKVASEDTLLHKLGKKYNLLYVHNTLDEDYTYLQALHKFVLNGGEAFIVSNYLPYRLIDLLNNEISIDFKDASESLQINFTEPALRSSKPYYYPNINSYYYFSAINQQEHSVLAKDQFGNPLFIKVPVGEGNFYFCTIPLAFTNFAMVDEKNQEFIAKSISYLPIRDVLWEDKPQYRTYYDGDSKYDNTPRGIKELEFLRKHPALWLAFLLACVSVGLFIIFRAKREQRPIPIIEKPVNSSVEFAQTIGRLYFNRQDHKNLAEKKILYCMDFIRSHLQIPIQDCKDRKWIEKIAQKAAMSEEKIKEMFDAMQNCKEKEQISSNELISLNNVINEFRKKAS
ncbi:MAG: hypothetical protein OHK0045_09660 [Raineya sp.]